MHSLHVIYTYTYCYRSALLIILNPDMLAALGLEQSLGSLYLPFPYLAFTAVALVPFF